MWGKVDQDAWQRRDPSPGEKGYPVQKNGSQAVMEKAKAIVSGDLTYTGVPGHSHWRKPHILWRTFLSLVLFWPCLSY